ncbi:hypothetical protein [Methanolapillus millepedarum]|uniref:Uncharacterized protein n=1 Tax=Methanolapillus millepedarum TaxID=3028296 RepID=A0AA96ZUV9_9EURY|nr:hypothetical protein MsAc7_17530 [Methanosarcinaceae archaeon Ac7]
MVGVDDFCIGGEWFRLEKLYNLAKSKNTTVAAIKRGDDGLIVAIGYRGFIATATDLFGEWTANESFAAMFGTGSINTSLRDIEYGGGYWVVCGTGSPTKGYVFYAADPRGTWTKSTITTASTTSSVIFMNRIKYGGGRWVLGSSNQGTTTDPGLRYSTSTPPTSFTNVTTSSDMEGSIIDYDGTYWIAAGGDPASYSYMVSTNASSWTKKTGPYESGSSTWAVGAAVTKYKNAVYYAGKGGSLFTAPNYNSSWTFVVNGLNPKAETSGANFLNGDGALYLGSRESVQYSNDPSAGSFEYDVELTSIMESETTGVFNRSSFKGGFTYSDYTAALITEGGAYYKKTGNPLKTAIITAPIASSSNYQTTIWINKSELPAGTQYLDFEFNGQKVPHMLDWQDSTGFMYTLKLQLAAGANNISISKSDTDKSAPANCGFTRFDDFRTGVPAGWYEGAAATTTTWTGSRFAYSATYGGVVTGAYFSRVAGITAGYNGFMLPNASALPDYTDKTVEVFATLNRITGGSGDGDNKGLYFSITSGNTTGSASTTVDGINARASYYVQVMNIALSTVSNFVNYSSPTAIPYPCPAILGWESGATTTKAHWYDLTTHQKYESNEVTRTRPSVKNIIFYTGGEAKVFHWFRIREKSIGETYVIV